MTCGSILQLAETGATPPAADPAAEPASMARKVAACKGAGGAKP